MTSYWARWRIKSPAARLFTQPFIQGAGQRKHQSSASLAFVRGIHRWPVNSLHKWPFARKVFPFDDAIMILGDPFKCHTGSMVCLHSIPFDGIKVSVRDMIYRNITTPLFVRIHAILTLTPSTNLWTETINNLIPGLILYIYIYKFTCGIRFLCFKCFNWFSIMKYSSKLVFVMFMAIFSNDFMVWPWNMGYQRHFKPWARGTIFLGLFEPRNGQKWVSILVFGHLINQF